MSEQIEKRYYTEKAEYGARPKDFTFRGMPSWVREMYRITERNARRRHIPFALTRQEFREIVERSQGRCMMTGIEFEFEAYKGSCRRPFAPSLDRVDSTKGYYADNCRLICVLVNLALNQWGTEPLMRVARNLVQRENEIRKQEDAAAIYGPAGFFTIAQFAIQQNKSLSKTQITLIASAAGRLSRRLGVERAHVHNMRRDGTAAYTSQNGYPAAFLERVFAEVGV